MEIKIRQEEEEDRDAVYQLVESAFQTMDFSDHDEQNLLNRLRKSKEFIPELSLVAEYRGEIVGHILFTEINVGKTTLVILAPLAVRPDIQNRSIGSQLIIKGHEIAKKMGYRGSVVLGHPEYYPKFGYQRASKFGIEAPFEVPDDTLMALPLIENGLDDVFGVVVYSKEFFKEEEVRKMQNIHNLAY